MSRDRFLAQPENEGLARAQSATVQPYAAVGPLLEVLFPVANTRRDVLHGLGAVPTGYQIVLEVGGQITGFDVVNWTADLAFLQASAANTRARLRFVVTPEEATDA